jgi:beta-lactam-binding protein with PASTA domain
MKGVRFKLRPIQNFFEGALLLLGLVVVALLSAITTMHFAIHGAEVHVPELKGMTVAEARSQTAGLGLNLEVDNRYYSSEIAAGHILSQSPVPQAVVRREWRVRVAESLGPQKVEVPSVVGHEERTASLNLRRSGLEAGAIAHLPWSGPASQMGMVLAQDPPPRAQGIERPAVNLLVAAPDEARPDGYVMPDLSGLPVVSAQAALTRVGLKPGEPKFEDVSIPSVGSASTPPAANGASGTATPQPAPAAPRPSVLPGTVLSQSPPPGHRVDVGATVVFTVAR